MPGLFGSRQAKRINKYYVSDVNQDKVFVVRSQPFDICGTECVMLEGYSGGYAVDGLMLLKRRIPDDAAKTKYPDTRTVQGRIGGSHEKEGGNDK